MMPFDRYRYWQIRYLSRTIFLPFLTRPWAPQQITNGHVLDVALALGAVAWFT
jgi:hypothetical protein